MLGTFYIKKKIFYKTKFVNIFCVYLVVLFLPFLFFPRIFRFYVKMTSMLESLFSSFNIKLKNIYMNYKKNNFVDNFFKIPGTVIQNIYMLSKVLWTRPRFIVLITSVADAWLRVLFPDHLCQRRV